MLRRGDLHIHSTASDGELSPWEVVVYARSRGIDTIAITDHNTTDGIYEAAAAGRQHGVAVIPAVELSTKYRGESIHLLGYFRDNRFWHNNFREILKLVKEHKARRVRRMLSNIMNMSSQADYLFVLEGIALLRAFGAAVVLAHPARISAMNLREVLRFPFDGIEAKYCNDSFYDTSFLINTAMTRFSFYTGGSDFHAHRSGYQKHCSIGEPSLDSMEIELFLRNSGVQPLN